MEACVCTRVTLNQVTLLLTFVNNPLHMFWRLKGPVWITSWVKEPLAIWLSGPLRQANLPEILNHWWIFVSNFNHSYHSSLIFTPVTASCGRRVRQRHFHIGTEMSQHSVELPGLAGSTVDALHRGEIIRKPASEVAKRASQAPSETVHSAYFHAECGYQEFPWVKFQNCSLFSKPFPLLSLLITGCAADVETTA